MLGKLGQLLHRKERRPYKLFQIEPSLECNLGCVMCPWRDLRPEQATMSGDVFSRIAGYLPLAEAVDFTGGGEPTMNPRLPDMVRVAKEAGCEVGFSTNGTMVNPDLAQTLLELGLDWISFSVDGATAATYQNIRQGADFDLILSHIKGLHDLKTTRGSATPRLMAVFVLMDQNYHELPDFVELAHSLGISQVTAKNLDVILKQEDDTRRLFSHTGETPPPVDLESVFAEASKRATRLGLKLRRYRLQPEEVTICEANPLRNLFFNWAGYVSPCITLSYAETRVFGGREHLVPCQQFGHILEEPLEQIWQKIAYQEFRRPFEIRVRQDRENTINLLIGGSADEIEARPPAPEGCRTCYYLYGI